MYIGSEETQNGIKGFICGDGERDFWVSKK